MKKQAKKLIELAKVATPGPWEAETVKTSIGQCHKIDPAGVCIYDDYRYDNRSERSQNSEFIAAANPQTITALCERLIRLEDAFAKSNAGFKKLRDTIEFGQFFGTEATNCVQEADVILSELDRDTKEGE